MIRAYQEIYLSRAQAALGDAFDYAINVCNIPGADFVKLFIASTVSKRLENGEPTHLSGKSGIEIVLDIVLETTGRQLEATQQEHMERSREYWIGWAIAYYQWYSDRKYSEIFQALSFSDMQKLYTTLHEADISKFVETADKLVKEHSQAYPHQIRMHPGRACPALRCWSSLHSDVRAAEQRYQPRKRRSHLPSFKGARLHR